MFNKRKKGWGKQGWGRRSARKAINKRSSTNFIPIKEKFSGKHHGYAKILGILRGDGHLAFGGSNRWTTRKRDDGKL